MVRIFSILAALTALLLLVAGGGTYLLSKNDINQASMNATQAVAKGISLSISSHVKTLQKTVLKIAESPEVIAAIESNDPLKIAQTATMLEQYVPKIMKLRLLTTGTTEIDRSSIPHMGNADLIMVQESLSLIKDQHPILQGEGENRHLAITSAIKKNGQPIGVVLASLKFDFLQSSISAYQIPNSYLELKQNKASLGSAGSLSDKNGTSNVINIPKSPWSVHYWHSSKIDQSTLFSFIGIIFFPAFLSGLTCFICYRKVGNLLKKDHHSLLQIIKDLSTGKNVGSYPMHLNEMESISSKIIQLKRSLSHEENDSQSKTNEENNKPNISNKNNNSGELLNVSFLDTNINVDEIDSEPSNSLNHSPLPNTDKVDKKPISTIFKANDIRGIVGKSLTKEIVFNIGRALGSEAKEQDISTINIGRDARLSSPELAESLTKGVISTGINILDLGLVPSPLVYFVTHYSEGNSGIVITGSHNPSEYNGLKIIINGKVLAGKKLKELSQRIDNEDFISAEEGSVKQNTMFVNEYIGIISDDIHIVRPMKIVVDCGNGAASQLAPLLLKTLGCEVIELFCEIDGAFPNHHPDPAKPENLTDLVKAVQEHKAEVGIAFDGDGDRLGVVDSQGNIIWPDRQMMLFAKEVLTLKPGAGIIYDVKCSRHLGEQIVKNGGSPLMWKTGHSFMKEKIKETGSALAGEMSGHFYFNDRWFGSDDALYAASRLIEILSADTRSSAEVFSSFPNSENTPEFTVELTEEEHFNFMDQVFTEQRFTEGKIIKIDGMRVEFSDGWGLVRASNSTPAITLRFEADTIEALQRIQSQFKELLVKIKSDIKLPF
ncbi:MAG: phosphomannomutase/phosphoglucomutase [Methylococcales bacterium]|nr:phosphomannomutase/phosphoglucomutase [Methylococcales bacterium]